MDREREETLRSFFSAYAANFNKALGEQPDVDAERTAAAFAECFVEASPLGVNCGKNDEQFRTVIPQGYEFYRSIGTRSMSITALDITQLDEYHAMARVHWVAVYARKDGSEEPIEFEVIYLVQIREHAPKIFAYITGDEQKLLREKGLIPE